MFVGTFLNRCKVLSSVIAFFLLMVPVLAEYPQSYYEGNFFDNYPYGDNSYYQNKAGVTPSLLKIGDGHQTDPSDENDRLGGACNDPGPSCGAGEGHRFIYNVFIPEDRTDVTFRVKHNDEFILYTDYAGDGSWSCVEHGGLSITDSGTRLYEKRTTESFYSFTVELPAGWNTLAAFYCERDDDDWFDLLAADGSDSVDMRYNFPAMSSYGINYIHLNEGTQADDCSDGIDNDGDWQWNTDDEWSGDYNYAFYEDIPLTSPHSGIELFTERSDIPDFGERNVDCFDRGCDAQFGPEIDGVQGRCNFPESAATPEEYLCFDNYDNDFDGLKDLEDPDCAAVSDIYDCRSEFSSEDWYNPFASDGFDACCGDDGAALFYDDFDFDTSRWEWSHFATIEDSFLKTQVTLVYTDVYSSSDSFIVSSTVDETYNQGYVDVYFRSSSTSTPYGEFFDHNLLSTTCDLVDETYGTVIRHSPSDGACVIDIVGVLPFTIDSFRVYARPEINQEVWFDEVSFDVNPPGTFQGDLGFILEPLTSSPYPTTESRYFCAQDDDDGSVSYTGGDWKWWDARSAASSEFAVHKLDGFDYISNSEQWFYCDAYGNGDESAIPVVNYGTFIDVTPELENLCPDIPLDFGLLDAQDVDNGNQLVSIGNYVFTDQCTPSFAQSPSSLSGVAGSFGYVDGDGNPYDGTNSPFAGCCVASTPRDPILGYSLFARGESQSCPVDCWDTAGNPVIDPEDDGDTGGGSGTGVDDEIKEGLNPQNSSYTTTSASCALFAADLNLPHEICSEGQYCVDGEFAFTTATDGSTEFCCAGGTCQDPVDLTCAEVALEQDIDVYNVYTPEQSSFVCYGEEFTDLVGLEDGQVCCVGPYGWDEDSFFIQRRISDSFICHQGPADQSLFGECCGDTYCFNTGFLQHDPSRRLVDSGNTFGTGSELHTIASFDTLSEFSGIVDYVRHYTVGYRSELPFIVDASQEDGIVLDEALGDWSGFEELTFDVYWDGPLMPTKVWIGWRNLSATDPPVYIEGIAIDDTSLVHTSFRDRFWQRVRLQLSSAVTSDGNINFLAFEFDQNPFGAGSGDSHLYVDNFVLRSSNADLQNYYCGGPSRLWLEDLVLPEDYTAEDLDPRQRACDAQLSFKWTGTSCCGSVTEKSDPNQRSLGEYYSDSLLGCWGGVPVISGTRISDAYDDIGREPYILYDDGVYYGCGQEDETFTDVQGDVMTIVGKDTFSIVGDWYCEASGEVRLWKPVSDLPRTKILFSKLQDLSLGRDFVLHCDEPGAEFDRLVSVNEPLGNSLVTPFANAASSETICVMAAYDGGVEEVVIGLPLDVDVTEFIDNNLRAFYPYDTSDQTIDCTQYEEDGVFYPMPEGVDDPTNFFVQCKDSLTGDSDDGVDVDVFYNKPLNIIYFSMEEIGGTGGFFDVIWDWLIDLFGDLFGDDESIPVINLDLYFDADFRHAYVAKFGDVLVKGVMERTALSDYSDAYEDVQYSRQARIDYVNFVNDLSGLKTLAISGGFDENNVSYCVVDTVQSLHLDIGPGVFFDWRHLTSNLQVTDVGGTPYAGSSEDSACLLHNGQIDGAEECDDTYVQWQEIIALADGYSLDCSDYDPTWSGTINQCVNGVLDTSSCAVVSDMRLFITSQSYSGNFVSSPDILCQQAAVNGALENSDLARALISTSYQDAKDIVADGVDVYLMNDELFGSKEEIFDRFSSGQFIAFDEFGGLLSSGYVWTGSNDYGDAFTCAADVYQTCIDWTSSEVSTGGCNSRTGIYGDPFDSNNGHWINDDNTAFRSCDQDHHLYCVVPVFGNIVS